MHPEEVTTKMADEPPILDRLARIEQTAGEERQRRMEFEEMVLHRLARIEQAIGLDSQPTLVRMGR